MELIYSTLTKYCPVMCKEVSLPYRILRNRGLADFPLCQHYKDCPTCNHCRQGLTRQLQALATSSHHRWLQE